MSYIFEFFTEYYFMYVYMYFYLKGIFLFIKDSFKNLKKKDNFKNFKKLKKNKKNWVEIWNIDTKISKLEDIENSSWNLYLKYKLSMMTSWHILEERFLIFFVIILFCIF